MTSDFERRFGFRRSEVNLANWRTQPFSGWAFQNIGELVPSAAVAVAGSTSEPREEHPGALLAESFRGGTVEDFLRRSSTDALAVLKAGRPVADWYAGHMVPNGRHLVFSISKSLTALLAGALEADGLLDPEAPVSTYVPEVAAGSAYSDAAVRHLLDMRVSLAFEEVYLDPHGAFARYRRATLWNPREPGAEPETLLGFIAALQKGETGHGGPFRYRSPNSDLLGIVVERAGGKRFADLMAELLWRPLRARREAQVTVDREGTARAAGGISVAARDLARVGEMMRLGGMAEGGRVVPQSWVEDTLHGGDAEAWRGGDFPHLFANGRYRNKWYATGTSSGAFCAIGIHGQWLYVDPSSEVVIVKLSSQPVPVDDALDQEVLAFFAWLSGAV